MYAAIINTPGYLPDATEPPPVFDTAAEAWQYLAQERRDAEDDTDDTDNAEDDESPYSEVVDALDGRAVAAASGPQWAEGTVPGFTPGYHGDHDLGVAYSVQHIEQGD